MVIMCSFEDGTGAFEASYLICGNFVPNLIALLPCPWTSHREETVFCNTKSVFVSLNTMQNTAYKYFKIPHKVGYTQQDRATAKE